MAFSFAHREVAGPAAMPAMPAVPAPSGVRSRVERATGAELGGVRVHVGGASDAAATSLGALAFTVGRDVHVGSAHWRPGTPDGDRLLAHELTHAAQQGAAPDVPNGALAVWPTDDAAEREADAVADGARLPNGVRHVAPAVQRKTAQKEDVAIPITAADIAAIPSAPYWAQKLGKVYQLTIDPRLGKDQEEQDAVLSAVWDEHTRLGGPPATKTVRQLLVPERKGKKAVAYRATFAPAAGAGAMPTVEVLFVAEGDAARKVMSTREVAPPADYREHDFFDLTLEAEQAKRTDALGKITWLRPPPADERLAVKFVVFQYFASNKSRDTEVDVIVPLADGKRRVLYTLRFQRDATGKKTDVEVERVGEEGKDTPALDPAKQKLDVKRVQGYLPSYDKDKDVSQLKQWLATRYKSISPTGTTRQDVEDSANKTLNADAGKESWFAQNYNMDVLAPDKGADRLQKVHGLSKERAAGTKSFQATELRVVEVALETMPDKMLGVLSGTQLVRQRVKLVPDPKAPADKPAIVEKPQTGAEAIDDLHGQRTMVVYDSVTALDTLLFSGGAVPGGARVYATGVRNVVHEFGHFVSHTKPATAVVQFAFEAQFVGDRAKIKTAPVTRYAGTGGPGEFFAEAFAIYHTDPAWMRANLLDMWNWFDTLSRTGAPPP